jgi:hypothetical protein
MLRKVQCIPLGGGALEIHKPKPWHGFREFLKEYLIIVVGVLTALGGEQVVERWHWGRVVGEAREAVTQDLIRNVRWVSEREAQSACIASELRRLSAVIDRASATGRLEPVLSVTGPARRAFTISSYDAMVSGQALAHMPLGDRSLFGTLRGWSEYLHINRDIEVHDWATLRMAEGSGRRISDAELTALRAAWSEAVNQEVVMRSGAREFVWRIGQTGLISREKTDEAWRLGAGDARSAPPCAPSQQGRHELELKRLEIPLLPPPAWPPVPPNWPKQ